MQTLDRRTTLLYSAGSIGAGAFFEFNNFVLPLILKSCGAPDLLTGLLSSTRSIEGVEIQPTVGAISDRIWTPHLGRRRIFIAIARPTAAMRYLATLFVYQFGINAVFPYLTLFIIEDIGETAEVAFALAGLTLLVTAASAVVSGKIAERVGSRMVLAAGWAILVLGAVGGTQIHGLGPTIAVVVLAGVGNGAATAMSWPPPT